MIWDIIEQTGFNKYFSDPNTTITTLLLDQNIITELKNQNPQLLEYLHNRKHDFMTQLIQYTITMPQEKDGYDRCHRLPYISSELLAIDSDLIYDQFFKEGEQEIENQYWKQLLTFLDNPAASNQILMGYFEKVVNNLYAGNKMKTTVIVANSLDRFINLLPNGSIADILKQCIILLNVPENVVLPERKKIFAKIINIFVNSPQEIRVICADIVGEIINKFQAFSSGDIIIQELLSSEILLKMYDLENSEAVNELLTSLIKKTQQRIINENDESVSILSLPALHRTGIQKYLIHEAENIRNISKSTGFIINQNSQTVRKSSKAMYSLLILLGLALQEGLSNFVNDGIISFFWNLVVLYPYNNILHVLIRKIFSGILGGTNGNAKECFLKSYEASILSASKQNLLLLRPFLYGVWMEAKIYPQITTDPVILSQFPSFVAEHFEPLLKYEVKSILKHGSQHKLIVDEEDSAAPKESQQFLPYNQPLKPQKQAQSLTAFENFTSLSNEEANKAEIKEQQFIKVQPVKVTFDFFGEWTTPAQQADKKKENSTNGNAFDSFSDFLN